MIGRVNKRKLKVAFLGGGINSAVGNAHFSALNISNQYKLVAGCFSRNKKINYDTARKYDVTEDRVYSNIDELIEKEKGKIDAIIILTPTNLHFQHVSSCIRAGIPVICEKALACSVEDAEMIKQEVEIRKGFLTVVYNYLGYPMLRELKNIIKKGDLGKINQLLIEMPQEGFKRIGNDDNPIIPQKWRLHDGIIPTISLDLGAHLHMINKYLTEEKPISVVSICNSFGNFKGIIDDVSCIIEYSNNLVCNMWFSKVALGKRNGLKVRIYAEAGSAEWTQENPEYLYLSDKYGRNWMIDRGHIDMEISNQDRYNRFKAGHPAGFIEAFANYYDDIAKILLQYLSYKKTIICKNCFGVDESIEGLKLFEAIAKSNSTRRWEKIKNE
ncbi:MAG: Gfo/Idh/MocA family protein [Candidatus Helarchaeota archaeon]